MFCETKYRGEELDEVTADDVDVKRLDCDS